jgi:hypothetical protein
MSSRISDRPDQTRSLTKTQLTLLAVRSQPLASRTFRRRRNITSRKPPTRGPVIRLELERVGQVINRTVVRESRLHIRESKGPPIDRDVSLRKPGRGEVLSDPLDNTQIQLFARRSSDTPRTRLARRQVLKHDGSGSRARRRDGHADLVAVGRLDIDLQVVEEDRGVRVEFVEGGNAGVALFVEEVVEAYLEETGGGRGVRLAGDQVGVAGESHPD